MNTRIVLIAAAALAMAGEAQAQWDAPSFLPPRPGEDIGIYLTNPDGADFGIQGIWRQRGNLNLGVRVGFVDYGPDAALLAAAETWGAIFDAGAELPVDVSWTLGAGGIFGDATLIEVPVGITIGRAFVLTPLTFQVYGHPRLALLVGAAGNQTESELDGLFDLGADLHLGENWKVRLGVTLGGMDAVGAGLAYRFGRGVAVR